FCGNLVTSGELKKNHLFELILDEHGTPIVRIARYVRSEQFLTTNKCPDACFPIFKTVPSPTDFPDIMDDFEFNMSRHNKVLASVKGCMSLADYADFVDVPRLFAERKKVPFSDLLKQIREKVLRLPERPQAVPTTQSPKEWLLNRNIWKEWAPESVRNNAINAIFPGTCGNAEQNAEEPSAPAAQDAEEPPVKKRRGRPRKNL
uniref:DUF4211 domain-containing protein n=1 Tax=Panagrellus redivivus TaxID=6233 RepID=A0A7E4VUC3_PANRE